METKTQGTEIVKSGAAGGIRGLLEGSQFRQQVAKVLPKHLTPDRFVRIACTTVMKNPKLQQADKVSFFNALLTCSQLGIEPDGRRAHLIPFWNKRRECFEVQLIIDYKGLVELVLGSGKVESVHADVVCENDVFIYNKGKIVEHKIDFKQPRGNVYAVYSISEMKNGAEKCDVMSVEDVDKVRRRGRSPDEGPWVSDWEEMAKKTVFRRQSKWLPLTPEQRDIIEAEDDPEAFVSTNVLSGSMTDGLLDEPKPQKALDQGEGTDLGPVTQKTEAKKEDKSELAPHAKLAAILTKEGISVDTFMQWAQDAGQYVGATPGGIDDLDSAWLTKWMKNEKVFGRQVEIMKGGAK